MISVAQTVKVITQCKSNMLLERIPSAKDDKAAKIDDLTKMFKFHNKYSLKVKNKLIFSNLHLKKIY